MSKPNKSAAASISSTDTGSDVSAPASSPVKVVAPATVKPVFVYDSATEFLTVDNLPTDWSQNQAFLSEFANAKNSHKGCKGLAIGSEHITVVHREGRYITRASRGMGPNAGQHVARKAGQGSAVDTLLNDRPSMVSALQIEHERLTARLSEVDKLLSALSA